MNLCDRPSLIAPPVFDAARSDPPDGSRQRFQKLGPEAFSPWIREQTATAA